MARIGIRREDKSDWEARVPLVPADVARLAKSEGIGFTVERSPIRAFGEEAYAEAGASIADDLGGCPIILGVKEIPPERFEEGKTYVFFSHVIKGQPENMGMLRRLMSLGCTLIDYEKVTDESGRRLVFFGRFAGMAGMIDTLWALGRRLRQEGIDNDFERIQPAHHYRDLEHVRHELAAVSAFIRSRGLPGALRPFVVGFTGYGKVSQGAQEMYDLLPTEAIEPEELATVPAAAKSCYKVVFDEAHMVRRSDGSSAFELGEYYEHPERYEAAFFPYVKHLTALVNCIYWEPRYPKFITQEQFRELYGKGQPRLRVVGDITCDINGSLACTTRATDPVDPVYVYDPETGVTHEGISGKGPVVLAVDFLPCEIPVDASRAFSEALLPYLPALARADFSGALCDAGLPAELERATIVYHGKLTEPYRYLEEFVGDAVG